MTSATEHGIDTAIVLAGGFGTRLRSEVPDLPKPLAPVQGQPFLYYVLRWLEKRSIRKVVLSTGYRAEQIREKFSGVFSSGGPGITIQHCVENTPLGTGGAVVASLNTLDFTLVAKPADVLVLNGDTIFDVDLPALAELHRSSKAAATLALRRVQDTSRYGAVHLAPSGKVDAFLPAQPGFHRGAGLINGGVTLVRATDLLNRAHDLGFDAATGPAFSLEAEHIAKLDGVAGLEQTGFFIDIGVPEDYRRAQTEAWFKTSI